MVILDLCGGTGSWSKPWVEAGYKVINVTLPEYDVMTYKLPEEPVVGILAAPPCTMFSLARTTAKTPRDFEKGMEVVKACLELIWAARARGDLKFWALENPTAYLRQFLGKPPFIFQPYDFGDRYKKRTDLWGYFNFPVRKPVTLTPKEVRDSMQNTRPLPKFKGLTVADRRAITPQGFARAFYQANKERLQFLPQIN